MRRRRVLVLLAHPSLERSEVNGELAAQVASHEHCTLVDLYAEYPSYRIDINREQQRLRDHDAVVFLFPLYWYSTPALLKEWLDLVLEHGFAYGAGATALAGKYLIAACSAGGPDSAYDPSGMNRFTLRQLLCPLEATAHLCHMRYLPPFSLFSARTALEEGRVPEHRRSFGQLLDALTHAPLDAWERSESCTVNALVENSGVAS